MMAEKAALRGSKREVGISSEDVRTRRWLAEDERILARVNRRGVPVL